MGESGRIFVVAGPSGAGKDTLISRALENLEQIHFSVSVTTREPAAGEVDGGDYHFISEQRFDELAGQDAFLEWEEVFDKRYGTLKSEVYEATSSGKDVLLEIDVKGALCVRSKIPEAMLIFIMPPSLEDLRERLNARKREGEGAINKRIDIAPEEVEVGRKEFDVIIVNDDVDRAAGELERLLKGEQT